MVLLLALAFSVVPVTQDEPTIRGKNAAQWVEVIDSDPTPSEL